MGEEITRADLKAICFKLDDIKEDIKTIVIETREIKKEVASLNKSIVKAETKIERAEKDHQEISKEIKSIWEYFGVLKDELKVDLKEYASIIAKNEVSRLMKWVVGIFFTLIGITCTIIKLVI